HIKSASSPRKKRLFGCACCYHIFHLLPDIRCKIAVQVAERFADEETGVEALATAYQAAKAIIGRYRRGESYTDQERFSGTAACSNTSSADPNHALLWVWKDVAETAMQSGARWHAELAVTCGYIRCIFGNPSRP